MKKSIILALALTAISATADVFNSDDTSYCSVSISKDDPEWISRVEDHFYKTTTYTVSLKNEADTPLTDVKMEYRIYQKNILDREKFISSEKTLAGFTGTLLPGQSEIIPIKVSSSNRETGSSGNSSWPKMLREKVGIRVRVCFQTEDKGEIIQEAYLLPDSFSEKDFEWNHSDDSKLKQWIESSLYHLFSITDAPPFKAFPTRLSSSGDSIQLHLKDGSNRTVKTEDLSEGDLDYIADWHAAYDLIKNNLRLRVQEKVSEEKIYHGKLDHWNTVLPSMGYGEGWSSRWPGTEYKEISYEITINNRSDSDVTDLYLEYCIYNETTVNEVFQHTYYSKASNGWHTEGDKDIFDEKVVTNMVHGAFTFDELGSQMSSTKTTRPIYLIDETTEGKSSPVSEGPREDGDKGIRNTREIEGKHLGIRYRVYLPTPKGNVVMVEYSDPKNLIKDTGWPTY